MRILILFKRGKDRKTGGTAIQPSKKIRKKSPPCNLCILHELKIGPFLVPEKLHVEVAPRSYFASQCKSGWWYTYPSEKYECVCWDDDIPNIYIYMCVYIYIQYIMEKCYKPLARSHTPERSPNKKVLQGGHWHYGDYGATGTSEIQVLVGKGKPTHGSIQLPSGELT